MFRSPQEVNHLCSKILGNLIPEDSNIFSHFTASITKGKMCFLIQKTKIRRDLDFFFTVDLWITLRVFHKSTD